VQLYAFDILALDGDDLRSLPLSMRKAHLERLLARRPDGIFISPSGMERVMEAFA
jgi:ATP-dependent DNA ligase